jgi:hypothetical protein
MLNRDSNQTSATIYQFPTGGRAALGGRRYDAAKADLARTPRRNEALCCESWYHQAAIEESKPVRDH